jgi:hypothetical protein
MSNELNMIFAVFRCYGNDYTQSSIWMQSYDLASFYLSEEQPKTKYKLVILAKNSSDKI